MIKQNRRIPGTINSTPINRNRHQVKNENQTLPLKMDTSPYENLGETKSWKQRVLQDREYNKEERLVELDLSCQSITDLEQSITQDVKLHLVSVINLENNRIATIPPGIFNRLSNLTKLYLNNNRIDKISFPYFKQNKLRIIDISNNSLKSLNLQHLDSLIKLNCSNNDISFLTLNASLQYLKCSSNKLSNIYFLENCREIQEIDLSGNQLYDLKFNFKPYIRLRGGQTEQRKFTALRVLDCSDNHIQFIEGMELLPNLRSFLLNKNQLSFTRHIINQICSFQRLQNLSFDDNPLQEAGLNQSEIINVILSRMPGLLTLNGQPISEIQEEDDIKSEFSGINEEPYQLFMDSHRKEEASRQPLAKIEWNFTLGDCENDQKQHSKINELSEIQLINQQAQPSTLQQQKQSGPCQQLQRKDFENTYKMGLLKPQKEIKLKIAKSAAPLIPHHIFFQQSLNAILPLSYIPTVQLRRGADLTSGKRLETSDDEHVIISRMFENRGGAIYVKKINRWNILQGDKQIFARNNQQASASMGFLLNDTSESKFRQHCKYNKLVKRSAQDIIGMHPNAFTHFHILIRHTHSQQEQHYQCAYLIETGQL